MKLRQLAVAALAAAVAIPTALKAAEQSPKNSNDAPSTMSQPGSAENTSGTSSNASETQQTGASNSGTSASEKSATDQSASAAAGESAQEASKVLAELHHSNLAEIEMGKLAQKNGKSDGVKQYGERLEKDHKDAEKKVKDLADQMKIKLKDKDEVLASKDHRNMNRLKALKGAQFDQQFAKAMSDDHKKDISMLKQSQSKLTGSPVGNLVSQLLPVLEEHERIANDLITQTKSNQPS